MPVSRQPVIIYSCLAHNGDMKFFYKKVHSSVVKMRGQSTIYVFGSLVIL